MTTTMPWMDVCDGGDENVLRERVMYKCVNQLCMQNSMHSLQGNVYGKRRERSIIESSLAPPLLSTHDSGSLCPCTPSNPLLKRVSPECLEPIEKLECIAVLSVRFDRIPDTMHWWSKERIDCHDEPHNNVLTCNEELEHAAREKFLIKRAQIEEKPHIRALYFQ